MGAPGNWMLQAARAARTMVVTAMLAGSALGVRLLSWYALQIERGCRTLIGSAGRRLGLALALVVTVLSGTLGQFASTGVVGIPTAHAHAASKPGKNTFTPSPDKGRKAVYLPGQVKTVTSLPKPDHIQRPLGVTMLPADVAVDPASDQKAVGSDKRLEVTVPAGAVGTADLAKVVGRALRVHVTQIAGPSGGTNSGHISLGTYQFTLVDVHGQPVTGVKLAKPLHLALHLDGWNGAAFDLSSALLIVTGDAAGGKPTPITATYDRGTKTLNAPISLSSTGSANGTWNTQSPEAQWSKQTDTSVDLSGGNLTYSYPLDFPAGPGGLTPKLQLSYSSAGAAEAHNPMGTSGWLGQGWDLSVGSISWGERNVTSSCTIDSCVSNNVCNTSNWFTCTTFENTWQMSDAYGNGGELIPQDSNIAPWYDDTSVSYDSGSVGWHLNNESRVKIIDYRNPTRYSSFPSANYPNTPPCWRAFLPNGIMEEFGCTQDSLQFYVNTPAINNNLSNYVYRWDLDMIVDRNGNQIHFTYNQRLNHYSNNINFPIDATLSTITYGASACSSTTTMCSGTSWNPSVQIVFNTDYAPLRSTGASCPTWTLSGYYSNAQTMRCDDVHDLSGATPKGTKAPQLQSLVLLNDVLVQVTTNPGSAPTWHTLRDYQFSYEQAPSSTTYNGNPNPVTDPNTGMTEYVAGYSDLTKIQEVGDDGSTALPALQMSYTTFDEYYVDALNPNVGAPQPNTNCGPDWNKGQSGTCVLWSQTYNARYLTALDNGRGWHEAYSYKLARNNTHGVNSGLGLQNPFACTDAAASVQQTYPCDEADDENWSRMVVTQRQASVLCVAADGSGCGNSGPGDNNKTLTSTWTYAYTLTDAVAKECGDCTEDMYWGNQNDSDKLDFYNTHFMGFHTVNVSNPDGSLQVYTFNTTMGYGVATSSITCHSTQGCAVAPWTDPRNALHGRVKEEDDYNDINGTTLLKQTLTTYNVTCPGAGVSASAHNSSDATLYYVGQNTSELDFNNPVTNCEITTHQVDSYQNEGGASQSGPHTTTVYSYTYSGEHMTQSTATTTTSNSSLTILKRTQNVWDDAITFILVNGINVPNGPYLSLMPAIQTTEDGAGGIKACRYTAYDGGTAGATGQQSSLTKGLATRGDGYSANCTAGSLSGQVSTTTTYSTTGNPLGTEDADGLAGVAGHTNSPSCTINSVAYSACATFDSLYGTLPVTVYNALNQKTTLNYTTDGSNTNSPDAANGWGQWLTSITDGNSARTTFAYDALGRLTTTIKPGDSSTSPTTTYTYPVSCAAPTGASEPCVALTTTQRLDSSTTFTSATFYDGWGRPVETLKPQSQGSGTCTYSVQFTEYDAAGRTSFTSDPYFVTVTQASCTPTYQRPDITQLGVSTTYDGLGRTLTTTDPLQQKTTTSYGLGQASGANVTDTNTYALTKVIDANGHQSESFTDGFGKVRYQERFTGNSTATYALYGTSETRYDWMGNVTAVYGPNPPPGAAGRSSAMQTTATYDLLGRKTGMSDADLGNGWTLGYDQNGNVTQTVDPRGASGTVYAGYDGMNRQLWRNTANNQVGAYAAYTYDSAVGNSASIGRLSSATFTGSAGLNGSYHYTYDSRGRTTLANTTLGGVGACPAGWTCGDIGSPALAGSQSYVGDGIWTLSGAGSDIFGSSDQFHFVYKALTGDGSITARVSSQTNISGHDKVGVMLRDGTAANAAFYYIQIEPNGNYYITDRTTAGGGASNIASGAITLPSYISVMRNGNSFSAATSTDGSNWTLVPNSIATLSLSSTLQAGVLANSTSPGAVSTATVDSVSMTSGGTGACPTSWTCQDIGSPAVAGTQSYVGNGLWKVSGAGADIWGTSDQFRYVYQSQPGDGSVSAHISSQTNSDPWAKAGVMLRASTASNAAYYAVEVTPGNGISVQYRATTGGSAAAPASASSGPTYVKVTRSGTSFTAYTSNDGATWTAIPNSTVSIAALSGTLLAGIEVCSHNTSALGTITVDHISPSATPPATVTTTTVGAPSGATSYPLSSNYNAADQPTILTYSDNEALRLNYSGFDWLTSATTTPSGGSTTNLYTNISYSGVGGAAKKPTGASVGNGTYTFSAGYDNLLRLTSASMVNVTSGITLYSTAPTYDAVGNVTSVATTLAAGTDNQAFCYDELNRLTWATSATNASTPCGGSNTAGTLTSAQYTQSFAYDALNQLTSSPLGSYTYGDAAHLHAATAAGTSSYTASYDAAGDMTCRATSGATTCAGTPTGAQLVYDAERRLKHWQSTPSGPTATDDYLYDGAGQRIQKQSVSGSTTTLTTYISGGIEEAQSVNGGAVTLTKYLGAPGLPQVIRVGTNGSLSYLASDGLSSMSEALDSSGIVTAQQLYAPYGGSRYSNGTMPTSKGFTGQRADSGSSGLDYYGARYYDPVLGQFGSADTVADGLNRYGYVHGNPTTFTDPTGHQIPICPNTAGGGCTCTQNCGDPGCTQNCGDPGCTHDCGDPGCTQNCGDPGCTHDCGEPDNSPHETCDRVCQDTRTTGQGYIWGGIIKALGSLMAALVVCMALAVACEGAINVALPIILEGLHSILYGIDLIHQTDGGSIGDDISLFLRTARVAVDIVQLVISVTDVGKLWKEIPGLYRVGRGVVTITEGIAKHVADTVGEGFGLIESAGDFITDFVGDIVALHETEDAWLQTH